MSRYPRGLKLLNYVAASGGNLEFYTELDHQFVAGDIVYIIGGIYDNTESLSYSTLPNLYTTGYKVISVNVATNGVTLDISSGAPIIYPYGTALNLEGDPQDAVNLAYNTFTADDMYKGVYICDATFVSGRFRKGTVNNGVFGNDYKLVEMNKHANYATISHKPDLTINQIVAKNAYISTGSIFSKTSTLAASTTKYKVIEDTIFSTAYVSIGNDNDGYGYSVYERLENLAGSGLLSAQDTSFTNVCNDFIYLKNITADNVKFGGLEPNQPTGLRLDDAVMTDCVFNSAYIPATEKLDLDGGTIETYIPLEPTVVAFGGALEYGVIRFTVPYDLVANRIWPTGVAESVFVSGIVFADGTRTLDLNSVEAYITDVNYTFASYSAGAEIELTFTTLDTAGPWAAFLGAYVEADFVFDDVKILYADQILDYAHVRGNVDIVSADMVTATDQIYLDTDVSETINYMEGRLDGAILTKNVNFAGSDWGKMVSMTACRQVGMSATDQPTFDYCLISINQIMQGQVTSSVVDTTNFHNSKLTDTVIDGSCYIYNSEVAGRSTVGASVYWDVVWFNPVFDSYSVSVGVVTTTAGGDFNGRKTPFKTDRLGLNAVYGVKNTELNKKESFAAVTTYKTQSIVNSVTPTYDAQINQHKYKPVRTADITANTNITYAIIDKGDMVFTTSWMQVNNRNDLIFGDVLDNNATLKTVIANVNTATVAGIDDVDFPLAGSLTAIDDNYIYEDDFYSSVARVRTAFDVQVNVHEIPAVPAGFPTPAPLVTFLKVKEVTGYSGGYTYGTITDGITQSPTVTTLALGEWELNFRFTPPAGTDVPACFIEVERIIYIQKDAADVILNQYAVNTNYCPPTPSFAVGSAAYQYDLPVPLASYPADFMISKPPYSPIQHSTFRISNTYTAISSAPKWEIQIEYWITWHHGTYGTIATGYQGGYREKVTDTYLFSV